MPCKSAEWLQEELEARGGASLLLLDCRPHELFESSHIETAINLAIPGLMLRRLRKGNLPIRSIIPNHADKERFATRCKAATVLLYDEATAEWHLDLPASTPQIARDIGLYYSFWYSWSLLFCGFFWFQALTLGLGHEG